MRGLFLSAGAACIALSPLALGGEPEPEPEFTDEFPLEDCSFKPRGGNAFFDLTPGRQLYLSNQQCVADGEYEELELELSDHRGRSSEAGRDRRGP